MAHKTRTKMERQKTEKDRQAFEKAIGGARRAGVIKARKYIEGVEKESKQRQSPQWPPAGFEHK